MIAFYRLARLLPGALTPVRPCPSPQDLLQLQYEGVAVMKLFNKAKVNVNLLIFLLNKKLLRQ